MKINTIQTQTDGFAMSASSACIEPRRLQLSTQATGAFAGAGYGMRERGHVSPQADAIKVKSFGIRAWSCPTT